jgi:hypothetical protein
VRLRPVGQVPHRELYHPQTPAPSAPPPRPCSPEPPKHQRPETRSQPQKLDQPPLRNRLHPLHAAEPPSSESSALGSDPGPSISQSLHSPFHAPSSPGVGASRCQSPARHPPGKSRLR